MDVRERLIRSGTELLESDGLHVLSLRSIARRAGLSHGAPRNHFPTYASLLAAIARSGIEDLNTVLQPAFSNSNPSEGLHAAATAYVDFAARRPEMFELIARHDLLEGAGGNLREITGTWFGSLSDALERLRDRPVSANEALALWANVHGLAILLSRQTINAVAVVAPRTAIEVALRVHLARDQI